MPIPLKTQRWMLWGSVAVILLLVLGSRLLQRQFAPKETRFDPKAAARARFEEVRGEGVNLSQGPCLGIIGPDWVADIVHDPRQPVDGEPANQCREYLEGKVMHFVELASDGRFVRMK